MITTTNTPASPAFSPVRIGEVDFINLTPHAIVLRDGDGVDHIVPPSGQVARIGTYTRPSHIDSLSMFCRVEGGHPTGWQQFAIWASAAQAANPDVGRIVGIVSGMFLDGLRQPQPCIDDATIKWLLHHLVAPLTDGTAIRENGHIVAVRGWRTEVLPWEFRRIGLSPD